jgi:GST-like protein
MGGVGPMFGQVHHFTKYNPGKAPYAEERYLKEAHRLYGVLDRRLADHEYVADDYSIADIAIWPWFGCVALGSVYNAAEFLDAEKYTNVQRWAKDVANRHAVKRGRIVNRTSGELNEQLHERHAASDFDTNTEDKRQA